MRAAREVETTLNQDIDRGRSTSIESFIPTLFVSWWDVAGNKVMLTVSLAENQVGNPNS